MSDEVTTRLEDDVRLRALMAAYQGGELDAFDQLHALLAPPLTRWLRGRTGDAVEAQDLVQETFLQLHRARHTYDPSYPVTPWAYAIARHVWLMHRRAKSRRPQAQETIERLDISVRADADSYAARSDVREALADIPLAQRQSVVWHHVLGLSFREIASRLGIRESAAKLRSSRGMAQLRNRLDDSREQDDE